MITAQEKWKALWKTGHNFFERGYIVEARRYLLRAQNIRREAALERIIARLQREKDTLATMCEEANKDVEDLCAMLEKRKNEFDRSISQAINEGDGVYRP